VLWAWFKSEILCPKRLVFKSDSYYYEAMQPAIRAQKMEREKFRIPRSVQDAIPIRRIFADGIFQVGNQYSKTWSFTDINYAIAGKEDKTSMFLDYSELLNALDSGASAKITIYNRRMRRGTSKIPNT